MVESFKMDAIVRSTLGMVSADWLFLKPTQVYTIEIQLITHKWFCNVGWYLAETMSLQTLGLLIIFSALLSRQRVVKFANPLFVTGGKVKIVYYFDSKIICA